jgi:hypothetical protein
MADIKANDPIQGVRALYGKSKFYHVQIAGYVRQIANHYMTNNLIPVVIRQIIREINDFSAQYKRFCREIVNMLEHSKKEAINLRLMKEGKYYDYTNEAITQNYNAFKKGLGDDYAYLWRQMIIHESTDEYINYPNVVKNAVNGIKDVIFLLQNQVREGFLYADLTYINNLDNDL